LLAGQSNRSETHGYVRSERSVLVQLVLIYCLTTNPAACIEKRPLIEDFGGFSACMVAAQPIAAEFVNEHPAYRLARWRCEIGKPAEKGA
jgi:hypothetical protein